MRRSFDLVLIGVVLVFSFLAASFAARNSDFWLHLASGRLLAEGRYTFGVDPFSFTTENQYWANHSWMFEWPLYLIYNRLGEQVGGGVLVVLKAVLVSLLALILLSVRRPNSRLGWPAACTLLAVLAMSPRLLLHSTSLSYFLLALTLWLLWRPLEQAASFGRQVRHYAPLLLLFVLWVNVDGWFLLGPLMAALFWMGDWIAPARRTGETPVPPGAAGETPVPPGAAGETPVPPGAAGETPVPPGAAGETPAPSDQRRRTPGWVCLAGLAVCLINPYHVHAFTLPAELMPLPEALRQDVHFAPLHVTPWQMNLYYRPSMGINLAGGAYLVLLVVGALSFLLNVRKLTGWRLLVWLTFAGLSAWLARTIPFFAVVAAPITALNLQDAYTRSHAEHGNEYKRRLLLGASYFALGMAALALIGLAWPGWLQGFHNSGHHVDWAVRPDGSLRRVAETLERWHRQGKLGSGHGFLYHPALVHYCAYFCPEEKGFLDQRLPLFREVADEYEEICQAFGPAVLAGGKIFVSRSRLSDRNITHLVLYDPILPRLFPALAQLANAQSGWTLLDINGQALIVGWRDREKGLPSGVPLFDAERLAFAPAAANEQEANWAEAPGNGPGRGPRSNDDFWSNFGKPIGPSPWQSEAAAVLLNYFEVRAPYETKRRLDWTLGLLGLSTLSSSSPDGLLRLAAHIVQAPSFPVVPGEQSPALPLLAVRAARQALSENPDDGNAYLQLGLAYLYLAGQTPENLVSGFLRPFAELRHIQIASALEQFLKRDPNSRESLSAHQELAFLYEGRFPPFLNPPILDAALEHRRAALKLARQIGPFPGENADAFARRLTQGERDLQDLDRVVSDRKNEFALRTRNLGSEPYHKAELALRMGLARLALEDVLKPSSIVLLGGEGIRLQVRLQLMMGQMDLIRDQFHDPEWKANKANLGYMTVEMPGNTAAAPCYLPAYEWLFLCQAAADGDYEEAQAVIKEQLRMVSEHQAAASERDWRSKLVQRLGQEVLLRSSFQLVARTLVQQLRAEITEHLRSLSVSAREQTRTQMMLQVIAGMLALERGQPQEATKAFRKADTLSRQGPEPLVNDPGASLAETYLRIMAFPGSR